jgi:hypothetical protein
MVRININTNILTEKSGQWIVLSGFAVAMVIVGLALLLNQAMISSHQSAQAEQNFPKNDILELRSETFKEAIRLSLNDNVTTDEFNNTMSQFLVNLDTLYLLQGEHVNIGISNENGTAMNVKVNFTDGTTDFSETGII